MGDTLRFIPKNKPTLTVKTVLHKKLNAFKIPEERKNLVWKAANLFYKQSRLLPRMHISLFKNSPIGGGLGSGSSNAATTLLTLNRFHNYPLSCSSLKRIAISLGSDIPFFLLQNSAWVSGKGNIICQSSFSLKGWLLLINPGFSISTPWAYRQWDKRAPSLTKKTNDVTNWKSQFQLKNWLANKQEYKNDFEYVIYPKFPMLKIARHRLSIRGASVVSLSGSGPTLFGLFKKKHLAQQAARLFQRERWLVWITQGA